MASLTSSSSSSLRFAPLNLLLHSQLSICSDFEFRAAMEVAAAPSCRSRFSPGLCRNLISKRRFTTAQMANASTYSSRMTTDIPLYEVPGASFDRYLEDKPRVFKAIFPDKRRSQQLNEEEWRIHMLPIQFLFLTALPVVDMRLRCKSNGIGYPPGVPTDVSKVLELDIVRWELQGLDNMLNPSQFSLGVKGALYPDRRGPRSRLKGQLQMSISIVLPPVLALVPEHVLRDVADSVLRTLVENMKDKVNGSLLADYSAFKRESSSKSLV